MVIMLIPDIPTPVQNLRMANVTKLWDKALANPKMAVTM